jgi:hypothetical protein
MRTQKRLQKISTAISLVGLALGFSVLGLLIIAKEQDGGASITGGILGILLGAAFLIAACLHWKCCDQIQSGFHPCSRTRIYSLGYVLHESIIGRKAGYAREVVTYLILRFYILRHEVGRYRLPGVFSSSTKNHGNPGAFRALPQQIGTRSATLSTSLAFDENRGRSQWELDRNECNCGSDTRIEEFK